MKAALLVEPKKPLVIDEVDIDEPGPNEVLIKTAAVGLCRSDLHFIDGVYPYPLPTVPGHEASGIVEKVGSEVRHVQPGDHVVTYLAPPCGFCELCATGQASLCQDPSTKRTPDQKPQLSWKGEPVAHFLSLSAFAEKMLVHSHACVAIRKDMPLDRAALLGCSVITGSGAVFNDCHIKPGQSVAVVGCGGIGLSAINAAKIAGAGEIVAIDPLPQKRELAEQLGATRSYDPREDNIAKTIVAETGGVHFAIEAVGRTDTTELAWAIAKRGGVVTVVGMLPPGQNVQIHGPTFLQGKTIKGSIMGSAAFQVDMPRLADFYQKGDLKLDQLLAERIPLDEINEGIDKLRSSEATRSVVVFDT